MKCILSVSVCVSMYKITQKFVDGFGSKNISGWIDYRLEMNRLW